MAPSPRPTGGGPEPQAAPPAERPVVQQISVRTESPGRSSGAAAVIVGIVALIALLAAAYLFLSRGDAGQDIDVNVDLPEVRPPDVNIEVPDVEVPDIEAPDEITVELPEGE